MTKRRYGSGRLKVKMSILTMVPLFMLESKRKNGKMLQSKPQQKLLRTEKSHAEFPTLSKLPCQNQVLAVVIGGKSVQLKPVMAAIASEQTQQKRQASIPPRVQLIIRAWLEIPLSHHPLTAGHVRYFQWKRWQHPPHPNIRVGSLAIHLLLIITRPATWFNTKVVFPQHSLRLETFPLIEKTNVPRFQFRFRLAALFLHTRALGYN